MLVSDTKKRMGRRIELKYFREVENGKSNIPKEHTNWHARLTNDGGARIQQESANWREKVTTDGGNAILVLCESHFSCGNCPRPAQSVGKCSCHDGADKFFAGGALVFWKAKVECLVHIGQQFRPKKER